MVLKAFKKFGVIKGIRYKISFAFIEYQDADSALDAIDALNNKKVFDDTRLRVE